MNLRGSHITIERNHTFGPDLMSREGNTFACNMSILSLLLNPNHKTSKVQYMNDDSITNIGKKVARYLIYCVPWSRPNVLIANQPDKIIQK
jgi:hypothetical protein